MFPNKIVLRKGVSQQKKRIVFRNTGKQDVVVKLYTSSPSIVPERAAVVVEAQKSIELGVTFVLQETAAGKKAPSMQLSVFARPVTPTNLSQLKEWLTVAEQEDKPTRRAFQLTAVVTEEEFSAPMVILDLPGRACLIEPQIYAQNEVDVATADKITARGAEELSTSQKSQKKVATAKEKKAPAPANENCAVLRYLLDTIYPPTQAVKA